MQNWFEVREKIDQLSSLDKGRQIFGADRHGYRLLPVANEGELSEGEERLGVNLPSELRQFYMTIGNGIAGPHYGLTRLEDLYGFNPSLPYQGLAYFRALAASQETLPSDNDYFEISHEEIQGLIVIIPEGCGHQTCLISSGENAGKVVSVSCDGYVEESQLSFADHYSAWLDANIDAFKKIQQLINSSFSMAEIKAIFLEEFHSYDASDLAVSLMGVEKPAELFGSGNLRIYNHAIQFPWYEEQLRVYRAKRSAG